MTVTTYTLESFARKHIMRNIQVRQGGLCHHCKKAVNASDSVVCNRSSKPAYYHLECAENLNIV